MTHWQLSNRDPAEGQVWHEKSCRDLVQGPRALKNLGTGTGTLAEGPCPTDLEMRRRVEVCAIDVCTP